MPSEEDRATAAGNTYKNLVKFGCAVFELCEEIDRQTDRQTKCDHMTALCTILHRAVKTYSWTLNVG